MASLTVMVMISSYENFVGRFEETAGTQISWLGKLGSGGLNVTFAQGVRPGYAAESSNISLFQRDGSAVVYFGRRRHAQEARPRASSTTVRSSSGEKGLVK